MHPERPHWRGNPAPTQSQQEAYTWASHLMLAHQGSARHIVVMESLRGIGKSTVAHQLQPILQMTGYSHTEGRTFTQGRHNAPTQNKLLVTATPFERSHVQSVYPEVPTAIHILKAMTWDESLNHAKKLLKRFRSTLSSEQVASYSLGIPLLAKELLSDTQITPDVACVLAASYLANSFPTLAQTQDFHHVSHYLHFLPDTVKEKVPQVARTHHIYALLPLLIRHKQTLPFPEISHEVSPLFLCQESIDIYNLTLKNPRKHPEITIVIPSINKSFFPSFGISFGFSQYFSNGHHMRIKMEQGTRVRLFDASERKTGMWIQFFDTKEETKDSAIHENHAKERAEYLIHKYSSYFQSQTPKDAYARIAVSSHDHDTFIHNPACIGWMTESFLQHHAIPYLVQNKAINVVYTYNPLTNSITYLSRPTSV